MAETVNRLTVGSKGEITLPEDVRHRYGLVPEQPVRVVETRYGILLVPLHGTPIGQNLQRELADWQALSAETWAMFPYKDNSLD